MRATGKHLFCFYLVIFMAGGIDASPNEVMPTNPAGVSSSFLFPSNMNTMGNIPEISSCTVEDLEQANDSQLFTILQELKQSHFFRHFVVNLEKSCPLSLWTTSKKTSNHQPETQTNEKQSQRASESFLPSTEEEDDSQHCASEGLPDLDPDAGPACALQDENPFSGFGQSTTSSAASIGFSSNPPDDEKEETSSVPDVSETSSDPSDDGDDFECSGGEDLDLDDDAEPLCHLTEDHFVGSSSIQKIISMALETIRYLGWESESQKQTYTWQQQTHKVVEDTSIPSDCGDDDTSEAIKKEQFMQDADLFWQDMCTNVLPDGDGKIVNLVLNPERNTGYNGTHIWRAIYEENCVVVADPLSSGTNSAANRGIGSDEDLGSCYEERVLYRLLSGLHTSTTLSIAKNYYPPSKRKNRTSWEPNPNYFMAKMDGHPEHIRNLHFSYVVMLRALRKASSFLYDYDIRTGNPVEDETATILLRRLLDSAILRSCQPVFSAFDETVMFQQKKDDLTSQLHPHSLQESFKGVFHNISSILDCVQCQQCKLHGKLAMLGYGTALKILFMKNIHSLPYALERNEIIALINTVARFSESIKEVRELTNLYWEEQHKKAAPSVSTTMPSVVADVDLVDVAVGLAAALSRDGHISAQEEANLVQRALSQDPELMVLAKHYHNDALKFWKFSTKTAEADMPDAIVVGSGLAGLAATLNMLDRGGRVVVVEKEHLLGGNSNKASSGINACCPQNGTYGDFLESFYNDTLKSAGSSARPDLIEVLVNNSAGAVTWLKDRAGVDLSLLAQLGGHAHKRTHRPSNGMAGAEIIYGIQKAVRAFKKSGQVEILVDTRVTELLTDDSGRVVGVKCQTKDDAEEKELRAHNIVLATGGFASDRRYGSYLAKYRPELLKMPATAGSFSTGDGITLAKALGAGTVDMDKVQIHPTGWVDPTDPNNPSKVLAAELMRGVGGVLLNDSGDRFCNELGTRAYVTDKMLSHNPSFAKTKVWDKDSPIPTFSLVLSSSAAADGRKHVDLYTHKGLLTPLSGVVALAEWMEVEEDEVRASLTQYRQDAQNGIDKWGKTSFRGVPQDDLDTEMFYAGRVTPVLHYCMGGITIDSEGSVLNESTGRPIVGLHAAGEVTGGVHGKNRLGGNSLLECTVFGSIVGKKLPIHTSPALSKDDSFETEKAEKTEDREITMEELQQHNQEGDCWVSIHGVVYDLTEFAPEHPAGAQSIHVLAGSDGTDAFQAVHNLDILGDFGEERVGVLVSSSAPEPANQTEC